MPSVPGSRGTVFPVLRPILTRIAFQLIVSTFLGLAMAGAFVVALSNIRFEYVWASAWLIILITALLIAVHLLYATVLIRPAWRMDREPGLANAPPEEARRALTAILRFIPVTSVANLVLWTLGGLGVAVVIWARHPITLLDGVAVWCAALTTGLLLSVFYHQSVQSLFRDSIALLFERAHVHSVQDPLYERFRTPLRRELLNVFGGLTFITLIFNVMSGYTQTLWTVASTLSAQAGDQFEEILGVDGGASAEAILAAARGRRPAKGGAYYLLDAEGRFQGETEFSAKLRDDERLTLTTSQEPGSMISRKGDLYAWRPAGEGKLLAYFPAAAVDRGRTGRLVNLLVVLALLMGAMLSITFFVARNITAPLRDLRTSFASLAEGDLSARRVLGDLTEAGELGMSVSATIASVRATVERIQAAHGRLTRAAARVGTSANEVGTVSTEQARNLEGTRASLAQTQRAVQEVSGGTESLSTASQEAVRETGELERSAAEMRESAAEVNDAVANTNSSIFEMATSIRNVSEHMGDLRAMGTQTAQSVQELATSIQQVEGEALETAALSRRAVSDAEEGTRAVTATLSGVADIRAASEEAARTISALGEQMREIGGVLNVIEEVAAQTHLLSLNAAIIAAQAGEHGQGFAVVADEIKKLAVRTGASTKEIAALLGRIQDQARRGVEKVMAGQEAVERGTSLSEQARAALSQIEGSARATTDRMNRIAQATSEQGSAVRLITESVEKMVGSVETVTRAAEEQQHGADQIAQSSESLRAVAERVDVAARRQGEGAHTIERSMGRIAGEVQRVLELARQQFSLIEHAGRSAEETGKLAQRNLALTGQLRQVVVDLSQESDALTQALAKFKL